MRLSCWFRRRVETIFLLDENWGVVHPLEEKFAIARRAGSEPDWP